MFLTVCHTPGPYDGLLDQITNMIFAEEEKLPLGSSKRSLLYELRGNAGEAKYRLRLIAERETRMQRAEEDCQEEKSRDTQDASADTNTDGTQ